MLQLNALVHAVDSFPPPNTPKRWSLVSQLVCLGTNVTSSLTVEVGAGGAAVVQFSTEAKTIAEGYTSPCKKTVPIYSSIANNRAALPRWDQVSF